MTLRELYSQIGGDYDQALRVLRLEKLIDKHIRRMKDNSIVGDLVAAAVRMEPTELFDAAHAMKGVCANLGLTLLSEMASEITEEFRPGSQRKSSDQQVREKVAKIKQVYDETAETIRRYEEG